MRLFGRGLIVAVLLCVSAPSAVSAAPILFGSSGDSSCGFTGATDACRMFDIVPGGTSLFEGEFQSANDIALFRFTLIDGPATFSAVTTSATTGFDPMLALFRSDGTLVQYSTPDDGPFWARNDDFDGQLDARVPDLIPTLLLNPDTYFLALTHTGNIAHEFLDLVGGFDWAADPSCGTDAGCPDLTGVRRYAFTTELAPVMAPVPEPGTLALLGTGVLAAFARKRAKKRA